MLEQVKIYNFQSFPFANGHLCKIKSTGLSFLDELGQLLDLCFGGHVHILVSNADDHAPQDGRI